MRREAIALLTGLLALTSCATDTAVGARESSRLSTSIQAAKVTPLQGQGEPQRIADRSACENEIAAPTSGSPAEAYKRWASCMTGRGYKVETAAAGVPRAPEGGY